MRIISWNANCKFRNKYQLLRDFEVAEVQECEDPARCDNIAYKSWANNYHWIGDLKHKGLGVFINNELSAEIMEIPRSSQRYFLPLRLSNGIQILAVWAMNAAKPRDGYVAQIHDYLRTNAQYFDWQKLVIVGDFNSNAQWDKKRELKNHGNLVNSLENYGLQSLYHYQRQERHGAETQSTFFMYRHVNKPYHIDYVFMPAAKLADSKIELGKADAWLHHSDHIPLFIDLA